MSRINTVIIPAAGWGTRLLPASHALPKELLPVYDRPALEWVVLEALASGFDRIVFISAKGKGAILDHFDRHPLLETALGKSGNSDAIDAIKARSQAATFMEIRQGEALGLGHAVLCGAPAVEGDYFAVMLPDDLYLGSPAALGELLQAHERTGACVLGLHKVHRSQSKSYGMVAGNEESPGFLKLEGMVEKPAPEDAPSDYAITGRYLLHRSLFDQLASTAAGALGEIQLTDALRSLLKNPGIYGLVPQAPRFDTGSPEGLLLAAVHQGLRSSDGGAMKAKLQSILESS